MGTMLLQRIAEQCQQGNREAYALLYTAMREPLRTICMHYVQNEAVANDLLHDSFLLIFSKIGELKDTACAEAWMRMVTRRVALLYLRQQKLERQVSLAGITEPMTPAVENHAEARLILSEILAAVDALPEGYRRVFRLSVLEGLTHQEIANLLHIEPHSSSSQLFRAKAMLRRWLRPMLLLLLVVALPFGLFRWFFTERSGIAERQNNLSGITSIEDKQLVVIKDTATQIPSSVLPTATVLSDHCLPLATTDTTLLPSEPPTPADSLHTSQPKAIAVQEPIIVEQSGIAECKIEPCCEKKENWHVQLAYSGMVNGGTMQLPYADAGTNPIVYDSLSRHHQPLSISLSLSHRIGQHWVIGTGLGYTRLASDFCSGNSYVSLQQHQVVRYLEIPVSASYNWRLSRRWQLYVKGGTTIHFPLSSTLENCYLMPDGTKVEPTTEKLRPVVQWSVDIGMGLQYDVTPHISFFVQPSLHHYFQNSSGVSTWNTEHPFVPSLPFGISFTY